MWILPNQISSTTSLSAQDTRGLVRDSEEFCQMCEKSLMWRSKPSLSRTWSTRLKRGSFIKHLFSRTLKPSLTESFEDWLISYQAAFPASRSVKLELEKLRKTQDTCSPSSQKESESANLELFSSKMSKESSAAKPKTENQFSNMSSEHWKKWVTEQRQEYLARAKSVRLIKEKESSSWATPQSRDGLSAESKKKWEARAEEWKKKGVNLHLPLNTQAQIQHEKNWSTPTAMDSANIQKPRKFHPNGGQKPPLCQEVQNFPTPTARDWKDTAGSKRGRDLSLPKMLFGCTNDGPQDQTKNNTNGKPLVSLKLNSNWVEQLMGLPIGWTDFDFSETE